MNEYPLMGIGNGLLNECGNPSVPVMAKAVLGYSPFQKVREGTKYSPFLITISTEDNRAGPGHARKFAHRLMDVGAPPASCENGEGRHGVSDALRNPELMTPRVSFLIDTLMGKWRWESVREAAQNWVASHFWGMRGFHGLAL